MAYGAHGGALDEWTGGLREKRDGVVRQGSAVVLEAAHIDGNAHARIRYVSTLTFNVTK